jgi:hypothetical protein
MTLFFIGKQIVIGKRMLDNPHMLAMNSDVVVIVDKDDKWITTRDRHDAHGQAVHPRRRAELLEKYTTISRPTS